jgi:hypothetical protein
MASHSRELLSTASCVLECETAVVEIGFLSDTVVLATDETIPTRLGAVDKMASPQLVPGFDATVGH